MDLISHVFDDKPINELIRLPVSFILCTMDTNHACMLTVLYLWHNTHFPTLCVSLLSNDPRCFNCDVMLHDLQSTQLVIMTNISEQFIHRHVK